MKTGAQLSKQAGLESARHLSTSTKSTKKPLALKLRKQPEPEKPKKTVEELLAEIDEKAAAKQENQQ